MAKLIVLKLIGNLQEKGYDITLELSEEGQRPHVEESGNLPANVALADTIAHHWRDKYRNLVAPYRRKGWSASDHIPSEPTTEFTPRIRPKKISYEGSVNARIRECKASADELQNLFLHWLDSDGFRQIDKCLRNNLIPGEEIRFLIRSEDRQLQKLPWHAWDLFKSFEAEPAFSSTRLQATPRPPIPTEKRLVKILAILGHSDGIDVTADEQLLKKLAPETHFLVEPTRKQLTDQLWSEPWDIVFFAGHSETEGDTGKIYINPEEYLTVDELWYGLRQAVDKGLQVAIFNSCDGLGLAQQLINDFQIPNLIVMRELVPDLVAQEFLKYFLSAFKGGRPFHLAAREARERLQGLEGNYPCASWLPTVYQNPLEEALYWRELTAPEKEFAKADIGQEIPPKPKEIKTKRFHRLTRKDVQRAIAISLLVTGLVMGMRWLGVLEPVELMAYDYLMRSRPKDIRDPNILIVEATTEEAENSEYGYPIGDSKLAEILAKIQEGDPLAIGLTFQRRQPRGNAKERAQLIKQFQNHPNLITLCSADPKTDELHGAPVEFSLKQKKFQVGFGDFALYQNRLSETIRQQSLSYQPEVTAQTTSCISSYSYAFLLADKFFTAQETEITIKEYPGKRSNVADWVLGDVVLKSLSRRFGGYQFQDENRETILLNYRNTSGAPAQTVSITELMDDKVDNALIQNRIVLIGHNNPFVADFIPTPMGKQPAVYIHAHSISNLIDIASKKRPQIQAFPQVMDAGWVAITSLISLLILLTFKKLPSFLVLITGVILLLAIYQICQFLIIQGVWMPLLPMIIATLLTMISIFHKRIRVYSHDAS